MKLVYDLAIKTKSFVNQYKIQEISNYSASQIAGGSVLSEDAFFGIRNPISGKKRMGILPSIVFIVISIPLLLSPVIGPMLVGVENLNSSTTATITAVEFIQEDIGGENSSQTRDCNITAVFNANGQQILSQALYPSNEYCRLGVSQTIPIKYDSVNPSTWAYNVADYSSIYSIGLYAGLAIFTISFIKFIIRFSSGFYGLRLKQKGNKSIKAAKDSNDINNRVYDLKTAYIKSIFDISTTTAQNNTQSPEDQINQSVHRVLNDSDAASIPKPTTNSDTLNSRAQYLIPNQDIIRPNATENIRLSKDVGTPQDNIDVNLDLD